MFRVWGLGFRVWVLGVGFGVWGMGFRFGFWGLGFGFRGLGFRVDHFTGGTVMLRVGEAAERILDPELVYEYGSFRK